MPRPPDRTARGSEAARGQRMSIGLRFFGHSCRGVVGRASLKYDRNAKCPERACSHPHSPERVFAARRATHETRHATRVQTPPFAADPIA
ncbi:hypothetical protein WT60_19125 [Burkholderia sp. MSMB617WGS]|nr:hypothetical protein WT60_19125 [Burkholderia sp. MSMB617WGS]